ncbi:MAG: hypothetical protein JWP89_847 [Schlesneria sp.]|nr:hypothetical protein [Schlesneria sp.]
MDSPENESGYAARALNALSTAPSSIQSVTIDDGKTRNAAGCMTEFLRARLAGSGNETQSIERTTFRWSDGYINLRNSVKAFSWTNLRLTFVESFEALSSDKPAAYLFTAWQPENVGCHVWVVPASIVHAVLSQLPVGQLKDKRTVTIFPEKNVFQQCLNSPDLSPYHRIVDWSHDERAKLVEAAKIDEASRRRNRGEDTSTTGGDQDEGTENDSPGFTAATVEYVNELPAHVTDGAWHEKNKTRYQTVLQAPTLALVNSLKQRYIQKLSPEVAGGTRHLSLLKKNDYGKGGYHDFYWFAFYDPKASGKTKSAQLCFGMYGTKQVCRYGFALGNYCHEYMVRLRQALLNGADAAIQYVRKAPPDTRVELWVGEHKTILNQNQFADVLASSPQEWLGEDGKLTDLTIIRELPLSVVAEHDSTIVDEVGEYFTWAWPFFTASMTGEWPKVTSQTEVVTIHSGGEDVDEDAPQSLEELSERTSLSESWLDALQESLLAKQQTIIVGPPGTSKTYIARQFARYFVRQRPGRLQGSHDVLYMHSNWTYEDFFEGIKPRASSNGVLEFQTQPGFLLQWIEKLKSFDTSTLHVLVLDEINRCDTAAVLGELLQLLEYRGTTVRLLSGRQFVFPRNVYIIGTMNSADRSIGRMDLALRRRFTWLNLHPQPETLKRWLERVGNNPSGFQSSTLAECNELLSKRGIPPEQQIGHALFMVQESDADEEGAAPLDIPLNDKHLRRIVHFSVLPYVRELFATQFGSIDEDMVAAIRNKLMSCVNMGEKEGKSAISDV